MVNIRFIKSKDSHFVGSMMNYKGDAGIDLPASVCSDVKLYPGETKKIDTGIYLQIPEGYEAQIRPRSGLSSKGILVQIGTVDSGYRGMVRVVITNLNFQSGWRMFFPKPFIIKDGDRIAQIVFKPLLDCVLEEVNVLEESERGENGFGSSGVSKS